MLINNKSYYYSIILTFNITNLCQSKSTYIMMTVTCFFFQSNRSGCFTIPKILLWTNETSTASRWHRLFAGRYFLGTFEKRGGNAQPLQSSIRQGGIRDVICVHLSGGSDRFRTRKSWRGIPVITIIIIITPIMIISHRHNIMFSTMLAIRDVARVRWQTPMHCGR